MSTRSKKEKSSQVPLFIIKLLEILGNPELEEVVGWSTSADSFVIRNVSRFTEEVLPAYYKHHNFASFIRQLNIYSFKKIRHSDGENVYAHPHFIRGKPHLIKHIIRKSREEKEETAPYSHCPPLLGINDQTGRDISELKSKQQKLYDMCRQFLFHNQKLLEENESLVHKLDRDCMGKEKRLEEFLIYLVTQKNYRALTDSTALPIHHSEHAGEEAQATPLEVLANNMDKNENFKKMKSLLENAFSGRTSRRRDNFTIVQQKQEASTGQENEAQINMDGPENLELSPILAPNEENSFLSLDAFDFAEDGLDLENSR